MPTPLNEELLERELHLARQEKPGAADEAVITVGHKDRNQVRTIQETLSLAGYELEIDGIFGPKTKQAVKDFQKEHGLAVDGIIGEKTLAKMQKVKPIGEAEENEPTSDTGLDAIKSYVNTGTVKKNPREATGGSSTSSGGSTRKSGSEATGSDGKGPKTTKVNGVETNVDPETGKPVATAATGPIGSTKRGKYGKTDPYAGDAAFERAHPRAKAGTATGGQFIAKGDTGQAVANTQTKLNETGANLKKDARFGPKTEQAVKNFQAQHQDKSGAPLVVDGIVGFKTAGALKRALRKK